MAKNKEIDKFENLGIKLWDKFDEKMTDLGYQVFTRNSSEQGRGSIAFKNDEFVPLINLCYWYYGKPDIDRNFISIHVTDRNGNSVLTGNTVAVYSCDIAFIDACDEFESRFDKMLDTIIRNYGSYSRANRLDSKFKDLPEDRQKF